MNEHAVDVKQLGHYISNSDGHYGRNRSEDKEIPIIAANA